MQPDEIDKGRPLAEAAPHVDHHDEVHSTARCRRCRRPLSAPRSIEIGMGWRCRLVADREAGWSSRPLGAWQAAIAEVVACAA